MRDKIITLLFNIVERIRLWNEGLAKKARALQDQRYADNYIAPGVQLDNATLGGHNIICNGVRFYGSVTIDKYSTIGENCILWGQVYVGRYCQLAASVAVYAINHATDYLTTYNNKQLYGGRLKELSQHKPVHIGHGVWMGHGAIVLPGVSIGNGAVIGAGTVVTKDVNEFAIVVGNPGREIRKRFDDKIVTLLSDWAWWELSPEELLQYEDIFSINLNSDPDLAVEQLCRVLVLSDKEA